MTNQQINDIVRELLEMSSCDAYEKIYNMQIPEKEKTKLRQQYSYLLEKSKTENIEDYLSGNKKTPFTEKNIYLPKWLIMTIIFGICAFIICITAVFSNSATTAEEHFAANSVSNIESNTHIDDLEYGIDDNSRLSNDMPEKETLEELIDINVMNQDLKKYVEEEGIADLVDISIDLEGNTIVMTYDYFLFDSNLFDDEWIMYMEEEFDIQAQSVKEEFYDLKDEFPDLRMKYIVYAKDSSYPICEYQKFLFK